MAMASSAPDPLLFRASPFHGYPNTHADRVFLISRQNDIGIRAPSPAIDSFRHLVQRRLGRRYISKAAKTRDGLEPELEESYGENKQGSLPVIDMEKLRRGGDQRKEVVDEIRRACEEWGIFYVVNHGVTEKIIEDMWKATHALISYVDGLCPQERARLQSNLLPKELREKFRDMDFVSKHDALNSKRTTVQFELLDPEDGEASPALQWTPHSFRAPASEFYRALVNVGIEFLEAISESLGMPKDSIYKITGCNRFTACSFHCYHPSPNTSALGFLPHMDPFTLTILFPDPYVTGLQVLKEEEWVDVRPMQGSFVINLGRVLEVLTNGKYKSCFHRVTISNAKSVRVSIPCFILPTDDSIIYPLPQFIDDHNPAKYPSQPFTDMYASAFAPIFQLIESS